MNPKSFVVRARWVVPVSGPPTEGAYLSVTDGIIQSVSQTKPPGPVVDLGDVCIIPGLVNAHTHLEFSDLLRPLGANDSNDSCTFSFSEWIRSVIAYRLNHHSNPDTATEAVNKGIRESIDSGVVAIGEIATSPYQLSRYRDEGLWVIPFLESLGRDESNLKELTDRIDHEIENRAIQIGLSPHAPYSVHPKLLKALVDRSNSAKLPLAIHLAETREELDLMNSVDGPFADLFKELGVWHPDSYSFNDTPLAWLKSIQLAHRSLIIHGNYLNDDELDFVASNQQRMHIVYCPRTHSYFGHEPYPLDSVLSRNINVAIGTDSRASNPDLNLFSEMKQVAIGFPDVLPAKILELGTINGATALGVDAKFGSLEIGKSAQVSVIQSQTSHSKPFDWLNDSRSVCVPIEKLLNG